MNKFVFNLLVVMFLTITSFYIIDLQASTLRLDINSLQSALKTIYTSYQQAESKNVPPAGYIISIVYDKQMGEFTGSFQEIGSRFVGESIEMPFIENCPFCDKTNFLQVSDDAINKKLADQQLYLSRSLRDRILIIPLQHVGNWFEMSEEEDFSSLIEFQQNLVCTTIEFCQYVETYFPEKLTTNENYEFELHLGSAGKQTIPHIHFRVKSGLAKGCLNAEEWATILRLR